MENVKEGPNREKVVLVNTEVLNERDGLFLSCKNPVSPSGRVEVKGEANRRPRTNLIEKDKNGGKGLLGSVEP